MKHSIFIMISCLILSCSSENQSPIEIKEQLIGELTNHSKVNALFNDGKIIILKSDYCADFDCEDIFINYTDKVQLLSRAEVFMKGLAIKGYLSIENIDTQSGRLIFNIITEDSVEKTELII